MRVESVTHVEKTKDKFAAVFEDGTELRVTAAQIAGFGLCSGRELSGEEYAELVDETELNSAKTRALRILGSRSMSSRAVERRLIQKGESEETARKTVMWLEDTGAVNDAEYAFAIARHYSSKGYGAARVKDELFRRGISRELWDDALEEIDGSDDAAYAFLEKKLRGNTDKDSLRRAADALYRRGFARDEINGVLNRYLENESEGAKL